MPAKGFREINVQDELTYIIRDLVSKFKFNGLELEVEREFEINRKRADIVVLLKPQRIPILVIETKRKYVERGTFKVDRRIDPFSKAVIGQALCYATLIKKRYNLPTTPFFATANPEKLVLFSPIEEPENYVDLKKCEEGDYEGALMPGAYADIINKYSLYMVRTFKKEDVQKLLEDVIKVWKKIVPLKELKWPLGHWLIEHFRIQFIDYLSTYFVTDYLKYKLVNDKQYYHELDKLAKEAGYKNGLVDIVGNNLEHVDRLARMMLYTLLNKIIFYKVLERHYRDLPSLKPLTSQGFTNSTEYLDKLNELFEKVIEITQDFEAIFRTSLFDKIVLPDEIDCLKTIDATIELLDTVEIEKLSDIIGHIYEKLIPAEERHQMGQFYTPPPIAELIVKWCIRDPKDKVLDPGVGSGTFLIEAYKRLFELKTGKKYGKAYPDEVLHEKMLKQLYGFDINPFPLQLTAMNLAMRNTKVPSKDINVILTDFFAVVPKMKTLAPYTIRTASGEIRREVQIPSEFDCVVGNPPYTRWTEIPEKTKRLILERIGRTLSYYRLLTTPGIREKIGIYIPFIIHSHDFLKEYGRLGMIISNSWLQTEYGIDFGNYLLDHFKIKTIIDFSHRLFKIPLIATLVILLEKESNKESRDDNNVVFIYVSKDISVDQLLDAIDNPDKYKDKLLIKTLRQRKLPRDKKWFDILFGINDIIKLIKSNAHITELRNLFEPLFGTIYWTAKIQPGLGANKFFYVNKAIVDEYKLHRYVVPAIESSRYTKFYTFTRRDWEEQVRRGRKCFLFLCHEPFNALPEKVREYIKEGERQGLHKRTLCEARAKKKEFYGWYDLGGLIKVPIFTPRYAQYLHRFTLIEKDFLIGLDEDFVTLKPKANLSILELKALLAYLNSTFTYLFIDAKGRTTAGGMIALEGKAFNIPIINIKTLEESTIRELANLFDKLEKEARKLGGADKVENLLGSRLAKELMGREVRGEVRGLWNTIIKEIDYKIASILGLENIIEAMRTILLELIKRRLARTKEAKPTAVKGESMYVETAERKRRKRKKVPSTSSVQATLDKFFIK